MRTCANLQIMPEDQTQLEELFHSLKDEGFALAPRDLIEVGRAMQAGFGVGSLHALYRCLQALWVRRPQGTEIFDRQFRRVIGDPTLPAVGADTAKPEDPATQKLPERIPKIRKFTGPKLDLSPVPIESLRRETLRTDPAKRAQPSRPWKYLPRREIWEPDIDRLQPPPAPADLRASTHRIDTGLLNYAGAAQILNRLRRRPGGNDVGSGCAGHH